MIRKSALLILSILASLVLHTSAHTHKLDFSGSKAYEVVEVIDGDTVKLLIEDDLTTVRLIGVDTPETVHPGKPVEKYGTRASEFLHNMLAGGFVYLEFEGERTDKFGRLLAYLYRAPDGMFVNLEIVRQGYGIAYTEYPFNYQELFVSWEKVARERSRGLWRHIQLKEDVDGSAITTTSGPSNLIEVERTDTVTVYVTKSGTKFHLGNCRYLSRSKRAIALGKARKKYSPCKVCSPLSGQTNPSYYAPVKRSPPISTRCQAITRKGTQCKRKAKQGRSHCWQHGG